MKRFLVGGLVVGVVVASGTLAGTALAAPSPSPPSITRPPADASVRLGKTAKFKVVATGSPKPSYQWQVSTAGGLYTDTGTDSAKLSVDATTADDDTDYRVTVSNASGSVTSTTATLTIQTAKNVERLKPLLAGLVDKGSEAAYHADQPYPPTTTDDLTGYETAFSGTVVDATWAQLEPSPGTYNFSVIDQSLANVAAYNAAHAIDPLTVKFRIWSGFDAPAWAKALDGPPIAVTSGADQPADATLGRYWLPDYEQQWTDLQTALAKHYDGDALVSEVAVTSCSTITAEPLVLSSSIIDALTDAGWTQADQIQCVDDAPTNYVPWKRTSVDFTMNVPGPASTSAVEALATSCASSELTGQGPVCILDNHGLSDTVSSGQTLLYGEIDDLWQQFGGNVPVEFQTIGPDGFDLCTAIGIAVDHHAQLVEVWPAGAGSQGFTQYTEAQLAAWDQALQHGSPPSCS